MDTTKRAQEIESYVANRPSKVAQADSLYETVKQVYAEFLHGKHTPEDFINTVLDSSLHARQMLVIMKPVDDMMRNVMLKE